MSKKLFTIPNRTLVWKGTDRHVLKTQTLEEVRDYLKRIHELQAPQDYTRGLHRLHVFFDGGQMTARLVDPAKTTGLSESMLVLSNGASHLHSHVLPPRFWAGFKQLAHLDADLAHQVWRKFADQAYKHKRVIRTVRMRDPGDPTNIVRAVRAVVSTKYGRFSHLSMVNELLDNSAHFARTPVLSWQLTDNGIRLRFLGLDTSTAAFAAFDPDVLTGEPLPVVDVWNSETGRATLGMRGGLYNVRTATGMGHYDDSRTFRRRHTGSVDKMAARFAGAYIATTRDANQLVHEYNTAAQVDVEDMEAWVKKHLGKKGEGVPDRVIDVIVAALKDPDVTPGSKLATIVDAITVAASKEDDVFTASDVEQAGARLMRKGLLEAQANNGVVPAPPKPKAKDGAQ